MKCKNCGTNLAKGDLFCMNCGNKVEYSNDNKKKGIIIAVAAVAVVVLVAIAVIVGISVGKKSDSDLSPSESVTQTEATSDVEIVSSAEQTTFNLVADVETTAPTTTAPATENQAEATTANKTVPNFSYDDEKDQFLFDSANKYITREYLSGCTRDEITVIMNEIYARHGYIFKDAELREYFNSQSWYRGTITSMDEAAKYFNSIEQKNVDTIYAYQKSMGWRN